MVQIQKLKSSRVSQEFYDKLMKAFPPLEITPKTSMQDIQYSAGEQHVLAWIRYQLTGSTKVYYQEYREEFHPTWWDKLKIFCRRMYDKIR